MLQREVLAPLDLRETMPDRPDVSIEGRARPYAISDDSVVPAITDDLGGRATLVVWPHEEIVVAIAGNLNFALSERTAFRFAGLARGAAESGMGSVPGEIR